MKREPISKKIMVLGIDGFEPGLAGKFLAQGRMPNLQKFIDAGACRQDLVMLGAHPTVTPPMWTTLATGANAYVHGITCFWNQNPDDLAGTIYNLDSRMCKAEPLWNVSAEAGWKTLVWHWPGSSWPPTSESPLLSVVDGSQPSSVNAGVGSIDWEKIVAASVDIKEVRFQSHEANVTGAGCIIDGLEKTVAEENDGTLSNAQRVKNLLAGKAKSTLIMDESDGEVAILGGINLDIVNSTLKQASGWLDAPDDAKELVVLTSAGLTRRPALLLKNEEGVYDRVALYRTKKAAEPLLILKKGELVQGFIDEIVTEDDVVLGYRNIALLEVAEDGSWVKMWMSNALRTDSDKVWHPKRLFRQIADNIGFPPPISKVGGKDPELFKQLYLPSWDIYSQWQADCLNYLIKEEEYSLIFSHLHNVDAAGHQIWHYGKHQEKWGNDETVYQEMMAYVYEQTDRYLGRFLHLLAEEWTVIITSDHGLISTEFEPPILGEPGGVNVRVMEELGYTVLERDEQGRKLRRIDWEKTRAVAVRGNHIYINLRGRNRTGIVEAAEKYQLEADIISDLYNYRDPRTGKRVVSIALRNKDAILLGMSGPECGDIIYFMEEGFNHIHVDSLSTQKGYFDTSVSPLFIASGKGIKQGFCTERVIRQIDVAPTIAALAGIRMPKECEGAPIYQILDAE